MFENITFRISLLVPPMYIILDLSILSSGGNRVALPCVEFVLSEIAEYAGRV